MPKEKKIIFYILLGLCAATLAGMLLKVLFFNSPPAANPIYPQMITAEDQKPLPIPEQAILKNRAIKLPILMYHHVGDLPDNASPTRKDLTVSPADFETQIKWLKEQGYESISLNQLALFSQNKFALPKKPVVITFDDGYLDVFLNAIPILQKYGFAGSFAIITNYPGNSQGDNFYASWRQIAQAQQDGMEITCHTQNHFDGTNKKFTPDYIFQNLSGCRQDIKNHLGFETQILVYPYGHYNSEYIAQATKAGFIMGVTVHEGNVVNLDDLMQLPRIRVHGRETLERFQELILH